MRPHKQGDPYLSTVIMMKVAFSIPRRFQDAIAAAPGIPEAVETYAIPDAMVRQLMDLFPDHSTSFEHENACSDDLLVVDSYTFTEDWLCDAQHKVNVFLRKYDAEQRYLNSNPEDDE